jgi:hypothetical protein
LDIMTDRVPIEIEMRADGSFVEPPRLTMGQRIMRIALMVAALAALVTVGLLFVGLALLLIPAALGAAAVAWGMLRYRMWKLSRR